MSEQKTLFTLYATATVELLSDDPATAPILLSSAPRISIVETTSEGGDILTMLVVQDWTYPLMGQPVLQRDGGEYLFPLPEGADGRTALVGVRSDSVEALQELQGSIAEHVELRAWVEAEEEEETAVALGSGGGGGGGGEEAPVAAPPAPIAASAEKAPAMAEVVAAAAAAGGGGGGKSGGGFFSGLKKMGGAVWNEGACCTLRGLPQWPPA